MYRVNFGNGQVHNVSSKADGYRLIAAQGDTMTAKKHIEGPREADLLRLLANVRAREGSRGHLTLVDGKLVECQAILWNRRYCRAFRIAGLFFGGGDWIKQSTALSWARQEDAKDKDAAVNVAMIARMHKGEG